MNADNHSPRPPANTWQASLRRHFFPTQSQHRNVDVLTPEQRRSDWWSRRMSPEARAMPSVRAGQSPDIVRYPAPMTHRVLEFLTTREVMGTLPLVSRRHNDAARTVPARLQAQLLLDRQAALAKQFEQPYSKTSTWLSVYRANSALDAHCVSFLRALDPQLTHLEPADLHTLNTVQNLIDKWHTTRNHVLAQELLIAEQDLVDTADRHATKPHFALDLHDAIWLMKTQAVGASGIVLNTLEKLRSRLVTIALTAAAGPAARACAPALQAEGRVQFVNEPPLETWTPETTFSCSMTHPVTGETLTAESPWPSPLEGLTFRTVTFENADRQGEKKCFVYAFNVPTVMDTPD